MKLKKENGMALITVILIITLLITLALTAEELIYDLDNTVNASQRNKTAQYAAEAGAEACIAYLKAGSPEKEINNSLANKSSYDAVITDNNDGTYSIKSTGIYDNFRYSVSVKVKKTTGGVYQNIEPLNYVLFAAYKISVNNQTYITGTGSSDGRGDAVLNSPPSQSTFNNHITFNNANFWVKGYDSNKDNVLKDHTSFINTSNGIKTLDKQINVVDMGSVNLNDIKDRLLEEDNINPSGSQNIDYNKSNQTLNGPLYIHADRNFNGDITINGDVIIYSDSNIAFNKITINSGSRFAILANGLNFNGNIDCYGTSTIFCNQGFNMNNVTVENKGNLNIISKQGITFNQSINTSGGQDDAGIAIVYAGGGLFIDNKSSITGAIASADSITFNNGITLTYADARSSPFLIMPDGSPTDTHNGGGTQFQIISWH